MGLSARNQKKTLVSVFCTLVATFILIVTFFAVPESMNRALFPLVAVLGIIFLLLGIILIVLTLKQKTKGKLKIFLILTGVSAICPLIFSILHNLFYALAIITSHIILLKYLMEFLHIASFLIALIVSPIGFLVGIVGSTVLFVKKRKKRKTLK